MGYYKKPRMSPAWGLAAILIACSCAWGADSLATRTGNDSGYDVFGLEAEQMFLYDQMHREETMRDSLMALLAESGMDRSGRASDWEHGFGLESDPKKGGFPGMRPADPMKERQQSELISRIEALSLRISAIKKQLKKNKQQIQEQLKGGRE